MSEELYPLGHEADETMYSAGEVEAVRAAGAAEAKIEFDIGSGYHRRWMEAEARIEQLQAEVVAAVAAEREACAKVCDEQIDGRAGIFAAACAACAAAIRALAAPVFNVTGPVTDVVVTNDSALAAPPAADLHE